MLGREKETWHGAWGRLLSTPSTVACITHNLGVSTEVTGFSMPCTASQIDPDCASLDSFSRERAAGSSDSGGGRMHRLVEIDPLPFDNERPT